uniref:DUF834 domain-containing protein n=1 Tax=Oryza nivara TaxID=4536 RepID=A0A0E0GYC6_ORYNI
MHHPLHHSIIHPTASFHPLPLHHPKKKAAKRGEAADGLTARWLAAAWGRGGRCLGRGWPATCGDDSAGLGRTTAAPGGLTVLLTPGGGRQRRLREDDGGVLGRVGWRLDNGLDAGGGVGLEGVEKRPVAARIWLAVEEAVI